MTQSIQIQERVHELYFKDDINCARTMLICLSETYGLDIENQTLHAAIGLHGAGRFRAQCGLVEGALLFIGIYFSNLGKAENEIVSICYQYAEKFQQKFKSLQCRDLRPNGFQENDPPHACENLTVEAVEFAIDFMKSYIG